MRELANISTFNRLCVAVENTSADDIYDREIKFYEANCGFRTPQGTVTPKDARTPNGKLLIGQQDIYCRTLQGKQVWQDYIKRYKEYKTASTVFKNMWASAVKHGQCGDEMKNLRDKIADFDASINQFNQELQKNRIYR